MAHHKSAKKRIRQAETRRARNRYYGKTTRNLVRKLRATENKTEAEKLLPTVMQAVDKLAKRGVIHKRNASNLKSSLQRHVNKL